VFGVSVQNVWELRKRGSSWRQEPRRHRTDGKTVLRYPSFILAFRHLSRSFVLWLFQSQCNEIVMSDLSQTAARPIGDHPSQCPKDLGLHDDDAARTRQFPEFLRDLTKRGFIGLDRSPRT